MSSLPSDQALSSSPAPPAGAASRPAGPVRPSPLNLARRPFVNSRPVVRAALALWLLGLLLLLGNVYLFWNYRTGSADKRAEIEQREEQSEREKERVRELEARLANMNLDQQNAQIDFLNRKIDERTFSWSLLFDRLAQLMPDDVRLKRLTPITSAQLSERLRAQGASAQRQVSQGQVLLAITAEAKSDEAVFRFVDNLFRARQAFRDANWSRRILDEESNIVEYEISVVYLPRSSSSPQAAGETPIVVEEEAPAAGAAPAPPGGTPQ